MPTYCIIIVKLYKNVLSIGSMCQTDIAEMVSGIGNSAGLRICWNQFEDVENFSVIGVTDLHRTDGSGVVADRISIRR